MQIRKLHAKARRANRSRSYTGWIDRRLRVALPPDMQWRVGTRVYFCLTKDGGIQISTVPTRLYQGRLLSSRIQRIPPSVGRRNARIGQGLRASRP